MVHVGGDQGHIIIELQMSNGNGNGNGYMGPITVMEVASGQWWQVVAVAAATAGGR